MLQLCHMLIGCPGSGKSTAAKAILEKDSNCRIVSSDRVRFKLFGDEGIQADWELIEPEILLEIEGHLQQGHEIIYDATNVVKSWRADFLKKVKRYDEIAWMGWFLETPLSVCQQWNLQRSRQVPPNVIEEMYASLQQCPPVIEEGFVAVYSIPYTQGEVDTSVIEQKINDLNIRLDLER